MFSETVKVKCLALRKRHDDISIIEIGVGYTGSVLKKKSYVWCPKFETCIIV